MIRPRGKGANTQPWYDESREWENNLQKIRTDQYLTIKDISEKAGVPACMWGDLANGMTSPLWLGGNRRNEIKPWVQKLLDALGCTFAEAFPRYVCDLERSGVTVEQTLSLSLSTLTRRQASAKEQHLEGLRRDLTRLLSTLRPREEHVVRLVFFAGHSFAGAGGLMGLTTERIRQIIQKALRKLRHPTRARLIAKYYEPIVGYESPLQLDLLRQFEKADASRTNLAPPGARRVIQGRSHRCWKESTITNSRGRPQDRNLSTCSRKSPTLT
jgi:RNA polymerase sigma factor (sigma-70 family)